MTIRNMLFLCISMLIFGGCASSSSGRSYPSHEARTVQEVGYGEVISVHTVEIEGIASPIGVIGGAAIGHAIGSKIDDPDSRWITRTVAGVAGAAAGQAIERKLTEQEGFEITVRLDDGSGTIAVVQAQDIAFTPGDRVRVLFGRGGRARVRHY